MIALRNVSKRYRGVSETKDHGVYLWIKNIARLTGNRASTLLALHDVSFTVGKGEIFGIYGANGAGKTTLIKLLSGLIAPTSGEVEVNGHADINGIKNAVSYISTNGWMGLEWQLTARENLILYGNIFGLSGKTFSQRCDEALSAVGMDEAKHKYISELSAGMRQKTTIARGLSLDRPVVFYDEPSVSLDVPSARGLRALIKEDAVSHGRTAVIASHNAEDIAICDRLLFLSKGEAIATGTPSELMAPFADLCVIEIHVLGHAQDIGLEAEPGVTNVAYENAEARRDEQNIKITAHKSAPLFDHLIDIMIERDIPVLSIKQKELSIQEIYLSYLTRNGGERVAV